MSIREIKDASFSTSQEIHAQLHDLSGLMAELMNESLLFSDRCEERQDFALRVSDLEDSIKMLRSMLLDFQNDISDIDVIRHFLRKIQK